MHLPFRLSRPAIVAVVLALVAVLSASAAFAAFNGRLKGKASVSSLSVAWDTTVNPGSNDTLGANDPSGPGLPAPTTETYHIGQTSVSYVSGELTATVTGAYDGYRATVQGNGKVTGGGSATFAIQGVSVSGAPVGAVVSAGIDPAKCGVAIGSTGVFVPIEFRLTDIPEGASFTLTLDVIIVPTAAYVPASCNGWAA